VRHLYNIVAQLRHFLGCGSFIVKSMRRFPSGPTDRERDRNIRPNDPAGLRAWLSGDVPGLAVVRPPAAFPGNRAG
jgi:hypothetical protein